MSSVSCTAWTCLALDATVDSIRQDEQGRQLKCSDCTELLHTPHVVSVVHGINIVLLIIAVSARWQPIFRFFSVLSC